MLFFPNRLRCYKIIYIKMNLFYLSFNLILKMKLKLFFLLMFTIFCISSSQSINWQLGNWAMNCDFEGKII